MSFQINGGPTVYYQGNMIAGTRLEKATDAALQDNFYTSGAGAKNMVWDDGAEKYFENKDGNDLTKAAYQTVLDHFDGIKDASQASGADAGTITAAGMYEYARTHTDDPKTQRSLILLMTNPDLLNKLDGSDHNGRITKDAVQKSHDSASDDSAGKIGNDAVFKEQMHRVGNEVAGTFMDRFEGLSGGSGGNKLFGAKGMAALATLNDGNHDYDNIFNAPKNSPAQFDAIKKWETDRKADGLLPQDASDAEVANLFNGGDFKNGGKYDGIITDSHSRTYANAANWIVNGNGDAETQANGADSFNKRWTDYLAQHNGAPSYKDLGGY
jgi:hypothetical protein